MAGDSDFLIRVVKMLGAFDDTALAAIASVGLVSPGERIWKRSRRSLNLSEASVLIRVGDGTVTMTESGPADALHLPRRR